jgi:hypothetical protein
VIVSVARETAPITWAISHMSTEINLFYYLKVVSNVPNNGFLYINGLIMLTCYYQYDVGPNTGHVYSSALAVLS